MADQFNSADDFMKAGGQDQSNPQFNSTEDFMNQGNQSTSLSSSNGPLSGPTADYVFSHYHDHIMSNIGQSAEQGWGSVPSVDVPEVDKWMSKVGLIKDYKDNSINVLKSFNEAIIRPLVIGALSVGSGIGKVGAAGMYGLQSATEQLATELKSSSSALDTGPTSGPTQLDQANLLQKGLSEGLGAAADITGVIASGAVPEEFSHGIPRVPNLEEVTSKGRAVGAVGEGEQGFFNTVKPTPENVEARQQAAKEAGLSETPEPEPPQTDIHQLVRQMDPWVFQEYDRLEGVKTYLKNTIQQIIDEKGEDNQEIETISQIAGLENRIFEADSSQRDLIPDITSAYRHAQDLLPQPELTEEGEQNAPTAPQKGIQTGEKEQGQEVAGPQETPTEPSQGLTEATKQVQGAETASGGLKPIEGTGETQTRGLAASINSEAVEHGLTQSFSDLPEYKQIDMKDQANRASEFANNDYENAKAVAMGIKEPPHGILPESVLMAVKERALAENDVNTIHDLASNSTLIQASTTMGQRLRALRDSDPTDPVAAIRAVQDAREAAVTRRSKGLIFKGPSVEETLSGIREAASKYLPSKEDVATFIKSIECDY